MWDIVYYIRVTDPDRLYTLQFCVRVSEIHRIPETKARKLMYPYRVPLELPAFVVIAEFGEKRWFVELFDRKVDS